MDRDDPNGDDDQGPGDSGHDENGPPEGPVLYKPVFYGKAALVRDSVGNAALVDNRDDPNSSVRVMCHAGREVVALDKELPVQADLVRAYVNGAAKLNFLLGDVCLHGEDTEASNPIAFKTAGQNRGGPQKQ